MKIHYLRVKAGIYYSRNILLTTLFLHYYVILQNHFLLLANIQNKVLLLCKTSFALSYKTCIKVSILLSSSDKYASYLLGFWGVQTRLMLQPCRTSPCADSVCMYMWATQFCTHSGSLGNGERYRHWCLPWHMYWRHSSQFRYNFFFCFSSVPLHFSMIYAVGLSNTQMNL